MHFSFNLGIDVDLHQLTANALKEVEAADNLEALDLIRVNYLGKKGELTALLKTLGQLPGNERKAAGQEINVAKQDVQKGNRSTKIRFRNRQASRTACK